MRQVIPEEFQGSYNVRWTRQFYVNTCNTKYIPYTLPNHKYVFEILKGHQITPPEPIRTIESGSFITFTNTAGQQEIPPSPDIDPEGGFGESYQQKESDKPSVFDNLKIFLKQTFSYK